MIQYTAHRTYAEARREYYQALRAFVRARRGQQSDEIAEALCDLTQSLANAQRCYFHDRLVSYENEKIAKQHWKEQERRWWVTRNLWLTVVDRHSPYVQMLRIAEDLGWPEAYHADLFEHDLGWLRYNPGRSFYWAIRPLGTHIYPSYADMQEVANVFGAHEIHYYSCRAGALVSVAIPMARK